MKCGTIQLETLVYVFRGLFEFRFVKISAQNNLTCAKVRTCLGTEAGKQKRWKIQFK